MHKYTEVLHTVWLSPVNHWTSILLKYSQQSFINQANDVTLQIAWDVSGNFWKLSSVHPDNALWMIHTSSFRTWRLTSSSFKQMTYEQVSASDFVWCTWKWPFRHIIRKWSCTCIYKIMVTGNEAITHTSISSTNICAVVILTPLLSLMLISAPSSVRYCTVNI